ncbi:MAG: Trk system potassium transporter TrkA [Gammaproteobacteria bacterium]|nr:Trk system potassium transporter TrkA [Gammaproteobacteria bacterium]MBU1732998.1 Trk system potassium transporter TrkA [Gammaproteobacteria bacterium]MBU1892046.1 Trk system potassium transporter TrkA [Gammaproteobacteria bacterium]
MKIVILGAGQVGASVAENLVRESNDITVVDIDAAKLQNLQDRFDLRTVHGFGSHPAVLRQAGIEDADMLLAVTQSDETNLVACKLAATLFNTPTKIARIRCTDYLQQKDSICSTDSFSVDYIISPEEVLTDYIYKLIEYPEALQVLDFAGGKVRLAAVKAFHDGPLVGHELQYLRKHMPHIDTRVAAIFRKDRPIIPEGKTVIEADDEVFFVAEGENIRVVMREMRNLDKAAKRVMIAGGGNIGRRLAKSLEQRYQVKLIDHNKKNSERLAAELDSTLVLFGNATDPDLLQAENVEDMDVFCALTNDDETNIMSALLAKRMGARKVIALINRSAYVDLVESGRIDIAISPAQATIGSLLAHVRRGDMAVVHSLRRGAAEALEAVAHGDAKTSRVVGKSVEEIDLPRGATIGAIVRGEQVIIAHHDTVIESEDHVILFVVNKKMISKVEKLFQVDIGFF